MTIGRYSLGAGDRFGKEGIAQVAAFERIKQDGVDVDIVWNKSNREHTITGTSPADQRRNADEAVKATGWTGQYFVDADHRAGQPDWFIAHCDFFTIDVTDCIGRPTTPEATQEFWPRPSSCAATWRSPDWTTRSRSPTRCCRPSPTGTCSASRRPAHLRPHQGQRRKPAARRGLDGRVARTAGSAELLVILFAIAEANIPIDTVAVKFVGRFNKGVDYVGDVDEFLAEFRADVAVIKYASKAFGLKPTLKISVHTGSDKFSLYPGMGRIVRDLDAGIHLKTAGTTWLEELIGLAEGGGEGLAIAKEVYRTAHGKYDELAAPYADVIAIAPEELPSPDEVDGWDSERFVAALRHDQSNPNYDPQLRQLMHVGFKIAVAMGPRYLEALDTHRAEVERNVTENLYERHMKPLFLG